MANISDILTVELLRKAADRLESQTEDHTKFPGWDYGFEQSYEWNPETTPELTAEARCENIRAAALAVLAPNVSKNASTQVSLAALGNLIRYIADMLEY